MARPKGAASYPQRSAKIVDVLWKVLRADSFEDLERGCTVLRKRAGEGDLTALGFIFDRIVGRPMPALPDVDSDRAFAITWSFGHAAVDVPRETSDTVRSHTEQEVIPYSRDPSTGD